MSILIVDDNQAMRRTIRDFVGNLANDFYECGDGSEALALYA